MENSDIINDYPPANAIEDKEEKDYPIIRCEDCHEILSISLNIDKKEIQLKCEKEGKTKNISFDKFFESLKEYADINCCQFCKKKNPSQKYYLCKTCSNKILCENCYEEHNKKDDIIKFKIDSTCRKHYNPYESYCPICKENKCSYCSIDHDENHEKDEFFLKKKLLKKNKLDGFKNTIKKIKNDRDKIKEKINSVIKELEEKIAFINNLKEKFFECLNMKLKFVELVLFNYEKKLKDFDANFFVINNLENQIKFNLLDFNLNKNDSLDKKIENTYYYLNQNLNSHFNPDNQEIGEEKIISENLWDNDITNVDYESRNEFKYEPKGFLDFNKDLFVFYSSYSIFFQSKDNFQTKFQIEEFGLGAIEMCKKISDEKILIYTNKSITLVDIIDNNDYKVAKKIDFYEKIYDFNSNFNLIYLNHKYKNSGYYKEITGFTIKFKSFPDYKENKILVSGSKKYQGNEANKLQFYNNNIFFHFSEDNLDSYNINNNNCYLENSVKISIDYSNASIISLNNEYYCLNDKRKVLILNKKDLTIAKTININSNNLGMIKISDKLVTIFFVKDSQLLYNNYEIQSNGIKWIVKKTITLLKEKKVVFFHDKNYVLFKIASYDNYGYIKEYQSNLFEIKTKK